MSHDRTHRRRRRTETAGKADVVDQEVGRQLVDWRRLAHRVWLLALVWAGLGFLGAAVTAMLLGVAAAPGALWAGVAALGFLASVVGVVALSALGGMLRAGERRERLAGGDVGLLPPQVRTRLVGTERHEGRGEHS